MRASARHQLIDVVNDQNLGLPVVLAVEATYILSQRTFPGYGHREEERCRALDHQKRMSALCLKFEERALLFKSYAASAI